MPWSTLPDPYPTPPNPTPPHCPAQCPARASWGSFLLSPGPPYLPQPSGKEGRGPTVQNCRRTQRNLQRAPREREKGAPSGFAGTERPDCRGQGQVCTLPGRVRSPPPSCRVTDPAPGAPPAHPFGVNQPNV